MTGGTGRKSDSDKVTATRSDRVFRKGDYWYFHTREGVQVGPFSSQELAEKGAGDYIGFAQDADPKLLDSLSNK